MNFSFAGGWDDYSQISRGSSLLIVHAFDKNLFTLKDIYSEISSEYKNALSEFEKKKLEDAYEKETISYMSAVKKINKFYVSIPITLPEYNFEKKGFIIKESLLNSLDYSGNGNGIRFSYASGKIGSVAVSIGNFKGQILIPISAEAAENLISQLSGSRNVNLLIYGKITKVGVKESIYSRGLIIDFQANTSTLTEITGKEIGIYYFPKFSK